MLARTVENSGIATVIVTMMPEMAERYGLPRIVGVEFPFGHSFGLPGDRRMQTAVARTALSVFERRDLPVREDVPITWPIDFKDAYRGWQPKEPSPVVALMARQIRERHGKD